MALVKEMEALQKNEAVLRFAGFTFYDFGVRGWMIGDTVFEDEPDTTDLTWLFKWCVPKLDCYRIFTHWSSDSLDPRQWIPTKFHDAEIEVGHGNIATAMRYTGHGDTPGEALREAIVALIGEE